MTSTRWLRLGLLLGVVAIGLLAFASGVGQYLEVERFEALLRGLGVWGPILYVLLFALLEPFGVFGIVFVVPGSLVWDFPTLFLLSWLGSVGAGIVGFSFARTIGRDWVSRHLPERMHHFDERLVTHGLRTVVIVRLLFFLTPPAHWMLGLSRVSFGNFVLGTAIGFFPTMALFTYAGKNVVDAMADRPGWIWLLVIAILALATVFFRRRSRCSGTTAS
jgi:uncharacterized membrane protein YdjX (TVP38/TMEM64 family)